ncbi:MAG: hypothetical protein OEM32_06970, partial [Acidimicrobiia bacterium]|nr:hypothetical protein [Acidimicrobiia bacterium]
MRFPFRYLLLIAATAMTGVTAYGVSSGPPPNLTRHVSPETASGGGGVGSDRAPVPPDAIPRPRTEPNLNLADGFERIEATRVLVPDDKEA